MGSALVDAEISWTLRGSRWRGGALGPAPPRTRAIPGAWARSEQEPAAYPCRGHLLSQRGTGGQGRWRRGCGRARRRRRPPGRSRGPVAWNGAVAPVPVPCPRRRCSPIGGSVAGAPPRRGGLEAAHAKARIGLGCRTTVGSDGGVRRGQGSNPRWTGHESALTRSVRRWPLTVKRLLRTSHESACVCPLTWGSTARALSMRSPRQGKTVAPVPARQGARRGTDGSGAAPGPRPSPGPQSSRPGLQPIPCRAL
jgi:hypothetical protein